MLRRHLQSLPPEQRRELRRRWSQLTPPDAERFRSLSTEQRQALRGAWRRLKELPPEEREAVVERLLSERGH